jgi:hypothetical protein
MGQDVEMNNDDLNKVINFYYVIKKYLTVELIKINKGYKIHPTELEENKPVKESEEKRENWTGKLDFLVSALSYRLINFFFLFNYIFLFS